jgi:hypothetical protein
MDECIRGLQLQTAAAKKCGELKAHDYFFSFQIKDGSVLIHLLQLFA